MQHTTIALATIFFILFTTGAVKCSGPGPSSSSVKDQIAKFRALEKASAMKESAVKPKPKEKRVPVKGGGSGPTTSSIPAAKLRQTPPNPPKPESAVGVQGNGRQHVSSPSTGTGHVPSQSHTQLPSRYDLEDFESFKKKINQRDFFEAHGVYQKANDKARKECGRHLLSFDYGELFSMINGISDVGNKSHILGIVLAHADPILFNRILDAFASNDALSGSGVDNEELLCNPSKFITILKKIPEKRQKPTAIYAIGELFRIDRTECLFPMISALQGEKSLTSTLADAAIQRTFLNCSVQAEHCSSLVEHFHAHPAISAGNYSEALYYAYDAGRPEYTLFNWLIERADLDDLNMFILNSQFPTLPFEFQEALRNYVKNPRVLKLMEEKGSRKGSERDG